MATDSTGISSGVRVALRLVTMSAVPSVVRYTFPYAAPLGMYLAQRDGFVIALGMYLAHRDGFFIVETVIPSMQAAEAGVVPGAVVLSMHRRSVSAAARTRSGWISRACDATRSSPRSNRSHDRFHSRCARQPPPTCPRRRMRPGGRWGVVAQDGAETFGAICASASAGRQSGGEGEGGGDSDGDGDGAERGGGG